MECTVVYSCEPLTGVGRQNSPWVSQPGRERGTKVPGNSFSCPVKPAVNFIKGQWNFLMFYALGPDFLARSSTVAQ